jgi:hypothetical protein
MFALDPVDLGRVVGREVEGDFDPCRLDRLQEPVVVFLLKLGHLLVGHDRNRLAAPGLVNQLDKIIPGQAVKLVGHHAPDARALINLPGEGGVHIVGQKQIAQQLTLDVGQLSRRIHHNQSALIQPLCQLHRRVMLDNHVVERFVGQKLHQSRDGRVDILVLAVGGVLVEATEVISERRGDALISHDLLPQVIVG